jgi:hypothetical protein
MADGSKRPASGDSTLNRLVSELSLDERLNLLDKLRGQANLSPEPLYEAGQEAESQESFDEQYIRLPWYYRLYFFILSFFKGRPPNKIFEESQIGKLGREIDAEAPGLYDYQRNYLLAEFCRYVTDLKEGARFFFTALDSGVNRDKGGFYAFLGSLEMEEVHKRLLSETDPVKISERLPKAPEAELRQAAFRAMEDAFAAITQEQRDAMYHNTRSLFCLKELSSFLFDRVIMAFGFGSSGQTCSVTVVRDLLITLNNILFSLKEPPPLPLLESLFVFLVQEKTSDPDFDMSREMRRLLTKSENALVTIRSFNKQVPLTRILRCACRDLSLSPRQIGGGEDWFLVYREYWKRQIEGRFAEYMRGRRHRDLLDSFRYFLRGTNLKILDNVVSDSNPDGLPVPEALSLSFLLTFYSAVFMNDINKVLRPILIDGEFFKRENRTEFTESYNDLIKLEDDIRKFERNIAPLGDYGKRYTLARQDISSLPVKRRKIQMVLEDASRDAAEIIERVRTAVRTMIDILNGIINKDPGGKYDTLGNLARLSGKTPVFINGVADAILKFQKALQLLDDIDVMESVR